MNYQRSTGGADSQQRASQHSARGFLSGGDERRMAASTPHPLEQRIITLLLGVTPDHPVPSLLHLEKEIFLLTRVFKLLGDEIKFEPSETGPRSQVIREIIRKPRAFARFYGDKEGIRLTDFGEDIYDEIIEDLRTNPDFQDIKSVFKMTRILYDDMTEQQLLLLMYDSYRDFAIKSTEYEKIIKEKEKLSLELLKKNKITRERCEELARLDGA